MTQYPNDKAPRSDWVYPGQQGAYPPPSAYPPLNQNPPYPYASRDGAQAPAPGQSAGYVPHAPPPQVQYHAPPPPQGYYPPQGPPPDYGYAQTHPDQGRSMYDPRGPRGPAPHDVYETPGPFSQAGPSSLPPSSSNPDGSGSGNGNGQGGIMMSLGSFFGNKGPPPMWQRPAPHHLPYPAFPPMCLISNSKTLSNGFPDLPPPCALNPHPFATHDITEEDWKRFLADVKKGASLSPAQRIKSNVIPMVTGMSLVTGFVATFAIEKRMKYKNRQAAGDVIDHWNHYFFGPRRMEVVLCQASERLSGRLGAAPVGDPYQQHMANGLRQRGPDDYSSDDDDSEDDDDYKQGQQAPGFGFGHQTNYQNFDKHSRRSARRERREARRARRSERRERKARGEDQEPYQLFITAI